MFGNYKDGKKEKSFENEEEFWDNFVDKKSQKYKKFFKMDTKELYDYINSIKE